MYPSKHSAIPHSGLSSSADSFLQRRLQVFLWKQAISKTAIVIIDVAITISSDSKKWCSPKNRQSQKRRKCQKKKLSKKILSLQLQQLKSPQKSKKQRLQSQRKIKKSCSIDTHRRLNTMVEPSTRSQGMPTATTTSLNTSMQVYR